MEEKLRGKLSHRIITKSNWVDMIGMAMKEIELFTEMTGAQKRETVINVIRGLIRESKSLDAGEKMFLEGAMDTLAGPMIDLIVNAETLGINAIRSCCCG